MATYAAYRHVELDKVGCGKRSIMKPPGGDCHDIFGADFHGTPSHHRVLKPPGGGNSSLFAISPEDAPKTTPSETFPTVTSKEAINGEPKVNGVKNGNESLAEEDVAPNVLEKKETGGVELSVKSSDLSSGAKSNASQDSRTQRTMQRNCVTGEGCQTTAHYAVRVHRQKEGNPVTGEGYDTPNPPPPTQVRTRVPPGGYSSGLW